MADELPLRRTDQVILDEIRSDEEWSWLFESEADGDED